MDAVDNPRTMAFQMRLSRSMLNLDWLGGQRKVRGLCIDLKMNLNRKTFLRQSCKSFLLFHLHGSSALAMPKEQKGPRQRPVSCRFCRSRKLRCSRDAPCSNCVSRRISCELEPLAQTLPANPGISEPETAERIRKVEELVESLKSQQNESAEQNPESSNTHTEQACSPSWSSPNEHLNNDVAWLESIYSAPDLTVNTYDLL
jgi:hypothetical protein